MGSNNLRVALCYAHALGEGGYPRDVRWLVSALHARGVRVVLCVRAGAEETREGLDPEIPVWDLADLPGKAAELSGAHFFGIFIREHLPVMRALQKLGLPIVLSPWAQLLPFSLTKRNTLKRLFLLKNRQVFRKVARWSVFSETEWHSVQQCFGKVEGARVFGGLGHFPVASSEQEIARPAKSGDDGRFRILFFGRCDLWQKGIDILIESYAILRRICAMHGRPIPVLTIAGRPFGDSEAQIGRLAAAFPAGDLVRIQDVPEADIPALLAGADLFAYLSRFDGPPRPIRAAIAAGVPVLASLEANMSEELAILGAGTSTTLDPPAIAAEMFEQLCQPPDHRADRLARAPASWSWHHVASMFAAVYAGIDRDPEISSDSSKS